MNLHAETANKGLGLIVAAMMVHHDQFDNQDPDRPSNHDTDEDDDSTITHPDPELEDPNAKPERHQEHQESDLEEYSRDETHGRDRDDLIDPIDPLN